MSTHLAHTAPSFPASQRSDGTTSLAVGMTIGAYEIEAELGSGSMGQVYLAVHKRLGRHVALKVLRDEVLNDQSLVERFLQEGRAVNQINHAHIVEVHDCVEERDPNRVYCVMEFLQGQTLAERMADRPASIDSIRAMGRQIASALCAAHAAGVVHRDLKPENIFLVNREGRTDWVKVLDFGIAKCVQPAGKASMVQTAQGAVLGTPRYMAPEQIAGLEVDARTDIYALGTILYELITGQPPFDGASFGQLAAAIITEPAPALPTHTAADEPVPPELAALVTACLSKLPGDRPARMSDVEAALKVAPLKLTQVYRSSLRTFALGSAVMGLAVVGLWSTLAPAMQPLLTVVAQAVPEPFEPLLAAAAAEEVTLWVTTQPAGALVVRADSGELLGKTPLEVKLEQAQNPMLLRIELDGYLPLQREVSMESDQRIELTLEAVRKTLIRSSKGVTEGVLDPY